MEKDCHWSINRSKFTKFNTISEEWYENISYTSGRNEETHNDLSKTRETLHVVESMEKVERFWHYEKYTYKKWNLLQIFSMLIEILSYW